jgi:hypothetical protein
MAAGGERFHPANPRLTPLDYRLALSIWIEAAGRGARKDSLRETGCQLREATQLERAAHMVQAAARLHRAQHVIRALKETLDFFVLVQ